MSSNNNMDTSGGQSSQDYAKSPSRVSKDNLYMIIALLMEDFPDTKKSKKVARKVVDSRKVGAVLVLPNDVVVAADCSRDGVHAVARLLMKHHDKAKGCKMFLSRKPCPFCVKLLVQSKVERVLFLPFEPEYYRSPPESGETEDQKKIREKINESKRNQVDNLFTASPIAQTKFVLKIEKSVVKREKDKTPNEKSNEVKWYKTFLLNKYESFKKNSEWLERIQDELPWPAFMKDHFRSSFWKAIDWAARVLVLQDRAFDYDFELWEHSRRPNKRGFNPVTKIYKKQAARHFMRIAHLLSQRTDDPKTGVGAVIVSPEMEILGFGWNGFPLKALYGEFPRASDEPASKKRKLEKKFPYVIHAEQNALLMRNEKNIKDATLFVTKSPCDECAPLIAMEGIKTVVVDDDVTACEKKRKRTLGYKEFPRMVREMHTFVCFETKR